MRLVLNRIKEAEETYTFIHFDICGKTLMRLILKNNVLALMSFVIRYHTMIPPRSRKRSESKELIKSWMTIDLLLHFNGMK